MTPAHTYREPPQSRPGGQPWPTVEKVGTQIVCHGEIQWECGLLQHRTDLSSGASDKSRRAADLGDFGARPVREFYVRDREGCKGLAASRLSARSRLPAVFIRQAVFRGSAFEEDSHVGNKLG